jgi:hypothetical protein
MAFVPRSRADEPYEIAQRLLNYVAEAEAIDLAADDQPWAAWEPDVLAGEFGARDRIIRPAERLLDELDNALANAGGNPDGPVSAGPDDTHWTLGSAMTIRRGRRTIHRGFLQPVRRFPILSRVPDRVVFYLITLDGGEDYLKREAHSGVGWHYHYLDWREDRSNVVLCWDTRWEASQPQTKLIVQRGLFVEPHGEKDNAAFEAKPWLWGPHKRQTMHEACAPDLNTWRIKEFRCASNKSSVVYPPTAVLTPHPSSSLGKSAGKSAAAKRKR